jgi:hypothetical protein
MTEMGDTLDEGTHMGRISELAPVVAPRIPMGLVRKFAQKTSLTATDKTSRPEARKKQGIKCGRCQLVSLQLILTQLQ